jgi:putative Ca2+/H+ antiporter (TMEM165/GDT1 family)
MSIVMAGMLVSFSGMAVIAAVIFGVLPADNKSMQYAFLAIGWIFVIIGVIIRYKGMKMEREQEQKRLNNQKK